MKGTNFVLIDGEIKNVIEIKNNGLLCCKVVLSVTNNDDVFFINGFCYGKRAVYMLKSLPGDYVRFSGFLKQYTENDTEDIEPGTVGIVCRNVFSLNKKPTTYKQYQTKIQLSKYE